VGIAHQEGTVAEAGTVGGAHPTAGSVNSQANCAGQENLPHL